MTDDAQPRRETLKRQRAEMADALDGTIEDTIRDSWLPNTLAWIVTVGGAFIINLVVLILLARP